MMHATARPLAALLMLLASRSPAASGHKEAPLYTNADLDRVAPFRDQTGVASVPAVPPSQEPPPAPRAKRHAGSESGDSARDESYWRREAARHRKRQETLLARAETLRRQIEQEKLRRLRSQRPRDETIRERLEERLANIERQRRAEDDTFEERARRAGALPGWLR